jgi:hypothetical protein
MLPAFHLLNRDSSLLKRALESYFDFVTGRPQEQAVKNVRPLRSE